MRIYLGIFLLIAFVCGWALMAGELSSGSGTGTDLNCSGCVGTTDVADDSVTHDKLALVIARINGGGITDLASGASATDMPFATEIEDTSAFHSTASETSKITFVTAGAGVYTFTCTVEFATGSTGYRQALLVLNDSTTLGNSRVEPSDVTSTIFTVTATNIRIATPSTDFVECKVAHTQAAPLSVTGHWLTVEKVGN